MPGVKGHPVQNIVHVFNGVRELAYLVANTLTVKAAPV